MRNKKSPLKPVILKPKAAGSDGANQPDAAPERTAPAPDLDGTAEHWAARINKPLVRSASSLVDAGHELIAAKARLDHGEWQKLVKTGLLHIHLRDAQRLMEIAENPVISKANNCSFLPASTQTLCVLAKADPAALQAALDAKRITPGMTIKEAKQFLALHPAPGVTRKTPRAPHNFDMERSSKRCCDVLWAEFIKWPEDRRDLFLDQLQVVVTDMKEALSDSQPGPDGPGGADNASPPAHQH